MEERSAAVVRAGLGGARWMALGLLLQKIASVLLNQAATGLASTETLGVASVRMDLALSTVLFVSREGFRLAVVRTEYTSRGALPRSLVATSWIPALVGVVMAALAAVLSPHVSKAERGDEALRVYCLAAAVECLTEPLHTLALAGLVVSPRAFAEPVATFARGVVLVVLLRWRPDLQSLAFGYAQLAFALVLGLTRVVCWRLHSAAWPTDLVPRLTDKLDRGMAGVAAGFAAQSTLKHALTQSDRLVLTMTATPTDAGIYALVSNYGALVARLLLQPTEDAARLTFAKLGAHDKKQAANVLFVLARSLAYVGAFFCVLSNYAEFALLLLLEPTRAAKAGPALRAYCFYVPCLALNGIFEAFAQASLDVSQLARLASWHVVCGVTFACLAFFLMGPYGAVGLIIASALAMLLRLTVAATLCSSHIAGRRPRLADARIAPVPIAAFFAAFVFTLRSRSSLLVLPLTSSKLDLVVAALPELALAVLTSLALLASIFFFDVAFVTAARELASGSSAKKKKDDDGPRKAD